MRKPISRPILYCLQPKSQQTNVEWVGNSSSGLKVSYMNKLSVLVPVVAAGMLMSGFVVAAPQSAALNGTVGNAPDRAEAYVIATAD